jgi:hypothetical protein
MPNFGDYHRRRLPGHFPVWTQQGLTSARI